MATTRRVYDTRMLSEWLKKRDIGAMDLVRIAGISVTTAYKITKGQEIYDLNVFMKVYDGLNKTEYDITWTQLLELIQ